MKERYQNIGLKKMIITPSIFVKIALFLMLLINFPIIGEKIRMLYKLIPAWALVVIIFNIKGILNALLQKKNGLLIFMGLTYGVTILLNYKSNMLQNSKALIWYVIYICLFLLSFQYIQWKEKDVIHICWIVISTNMLNVVPSVILYLFNITIRYNGQPIGPVGIMGRLYGIASGVNQCALIAFVAILCASYVIKKNYRINLVKKIILILNIILSYIFVIASGTRAVKYAGVIVCAFLVTFEVTGRIPQLKNKILEFIVQIISYAIAVVAVLAIVELSKYPISGLYGCLNINIEQDMVFERSVESEHTSNAHRQELWRESIELWKEHKIFGIGSANTTVYCNSSEKEFKYINIGDYGASTHGTYIAVLLYSGVVGFLVFGMILVYYMSDIFIWLYAGVKQKNLSCDMVILFGICLQISIYAVFATVIIFSNVQGTLLFWTFLGVLRGYKDNMIEKLCV